MSVSRTIAAMDDRSGRRDLALAAMTIVGLSRLLEPPALWLVAVLLLIAMLFGTLQVLADEVHPSEVATGVPIESLILPSVAAVACLGAIRLVPFGLWLAPALLVTGLLVARSIAIEARIHADQEGLSAADRTSLLVTILLVGFLGFTGVAAMVPGGLVQPTARWRRDAAHPGDRPADPGGRRCGHRVPPGIPGGLAAAGDPSRRAAGPR